VIEAVTEDLAVKREVLRVCSSSAPASAVIATNTSSLSVDILARSCNHPQRFLGAHWFNPPEWTPGVEVVTGAATARDVVDALVRLLQGIGKRPIIVADSVGFIANRLQMALFCEAARCVDEGLATVEGLDEIVRSSFGFRLPFYGPFQIADLAGLETYAVVARQHEEAFGDRFTVSARLRSLVERGDHGTRAGAGFYQYEAGAAEDIVHQRDRYYAALESLLHRLGRQSAVEDAPAP
jgi:3-hydroxybutyryl-CoA dehydrogenase